MTRDHWIQSYRDLLPFPAVFDKNGGEGPAFIYYALILCGGSQQSRSDYIIDGGAGSFRENVCGSKSSGKLEFVEEGMAEDPIFGSVPGRIYNSQDAHPPRAYLLSMKEVCSGRPSGHVSRC